MQHWFGEKLCEFSYNENGEAIVSVTFPRAKIFKPQPDGSIKVYQGKRTVTHTIASLDALILSCKNPADLPVISEMLKVFADPTQDHEAYAASQIQQQPQG